MINYSLTVCVTQMRAQIENSYLLPSDGVQGVN